jgi:hypothetical protein
VIVTGPDGDLNVKSWVGSETLVAARVPPLRVGPEYVKVTASPAFSV